MNLNADVIRTCDFIMIDVEYILYLKCLAKCVIKLP